MNRRFGVPALAGPAPPPAKAGTPNDEPPRFKASTNANVLDGSPLPRREESEKIPAL